MVRFCTLVVAAVCFGSSAYATPVDSLKAGDVAPALTITRHLAAPPNAPTTLEGLRGSWVVVEFWAAWCAGCVADVPHMDSLATALAGEKIALITLSADAPSTLRGFFATHPTKTWVSYDSTGATAARYRIAGYPQAVVIDPHGRIAAFANPRALTVERLRSLMRDASPTIPFQYYRFSGTPADFAWDKTTTLDAESPELYAQAVVRRSVAAQTFLRWRGTPGRILGDGVKLPQLLQHAYGASSHAFQANLPGADAKFRVSVVAAERTHAAARALLRDALGHAFALNVREDPRPMDVVVLRRRPGGNPAQFAPVAPGTPLDGIASWTGIHVTGVDIGYLIETLESFAFGTVVVDETGLTGVYKIDLFWEAGKPATVEAALRTAGFDVVRERRTIPVLVVDARR